MFPVTTETCRGEEYMCSLLFPHFEIKSWVAGKWKQNYEKTYCKSVNKSELLICLPISGSRQNFFELHLLYQCWSYWTCILLHSGSIGKDIAFSILSFFQVLLVQTNAQNFISCQFSFFFPNKRLILYEQNFLEYASQIKI